jgi:hypothetical protein
MTFDSPSLTDLDLRLYASLTPDDRDDLLQELLVAARKGADAMVAVVDVLLFDRQVLRVARAKRKRTVTRRCPSSGVLRFYEIRFSAWPGVPGCRQLRSLNPQGRRFESFRRTSRGEGRTDGSRMVINGRLRAGLGARAPVRSSAASGSGPPYYSSTGRFPPSSLDVHAPVGHEHAPGREAALV